MLFGSKPYDHILVLQLSRTTYRHNNKLHHIALIKLTVVKVVVSSKGTCNNCLFVKEFNYFLNCSNKIFDFLASNS